jgi:deoxycytidylate deaminase
MLVVKYNTKFDNQIDSLRRVASRSPLNHKHGACLMTGNKIVSIGFNKYIRQDIINDKLVKFSMHAEMDALCKLDKVKGMDILIIRIGNDLKLKNSRPCNSCINKLASRGIRKVFYSNECGNIVFEYIDDMEKIHYSSGERIRCKQLNKTTPLNM